MGASEGCACLMFMDGTSLLNDGVDGSADGRTRPSLLYREIGGGFLNMTVISLAGRR